jgi:hypothetical protein
MLIQFLFLLFLIKSSLEANVEPLTTLENNDGSVAVSFLKDMVKKYKLDSKSLKLPLTIESDFYHLVELCKAIKKTDPPSSFQKSLDRIASEEYYPLLEEYTLSHTKEFLQIVIKSKISFQMFFINFYGFYKTCYDPPFFHLNEKSRLLFSSLVECIRASEEGSKNTFIYKKVKNIFCEAGFRIYGQGIIHRLGKPLISAKEWEERKEIVYLHLKLSKILKNFTELEWASTMNIGISFQNNRFQFLLDHVSVLNENEIDFQGLWVVYKRALRYITKSDEYLRFRKMSPITVYTHPSVKWLPLLSFYLHHFLFSNFTQKEISQIDVRLLSLAVLYWNEGGSEQMPYLLLDPQDQIKKAIQKIETEMLLKFDEAYSKYPLFRKYFNASESSGKGQFWIKETQNFFKNYAEDAFDENDCQLDLNKRLVKIYFRLLFYQENPQMIPNSPPV